MSKNLATTTVATAPSPATSGTSLTVATGTGSRLYDGMAVLHPAGAVPTAANAEVVSITVSGDVVTLTRAQESSTARTVVAGDILTQGITAAMWDTLVASNAGKAAASHAHSAADVTSGTLPLTRGGTGGTDAATARTSLGLGTAATMTPATIAADPALTATYAPFSAGAWGNYVLPIGDSITASNSGTAQAQGWFNHLHTRSLGRIRWAGMQAQGGFRVADAAATLVPNTIAQSPRPNGVIVMLGANDCANAGGVGFDLATWANTYETGVIQPLLNAGIKVALSLITPSDGSGGGVALIKANISAANAWIRARARYAGWPLIDAYSPLVDPADGSLRLAYRSGGTDRVHPNFAGYKAIAEWNVAALSNWFAPCDQGLSAWVEDPPGNLTKKGLFLVDTDANGFADGLGPSGGGTGWTGSLVAPSAADRLVGNWQQVVRGTTASNSGWIFDAAPAGSWSVGDVMEFSARIQTTGFTGSGSTYGVYAKNQNDTSTYGIVGWTEDISDGLVNVRFTIPSTHTGILYAYFANFGGTVPTQTTTFRVGQVTLRNLTRSTPILLT